MQIVYDPTAALEFQFTVSPHSAVAKAAIDAMRNGSSPQDLARFAIARHGYLNADSFFGVTYPSDLDDFDCANDEAIPDGQIQVLAGYGDSHAVGHLISESEYLELLRQYLLVVGLPNDAKQIAELIESHG